MKPSAFDYVRVDCADEAVEILAEQGDEARILAGGQSLMPMLNMRMAQPKVIVDISRAEDLAAARVDGAALAVRAAVTQATVERRARLADEVPMLAQALPHLGHFQTRNRGTVCGSIAHADPSAELPLCLAVLGGEVVLRSRARRRTLQAEAFFLGALATARDPTEIVEEVRFPLALAAERYGFVEIAMRHGDFAIVGLAVIVSAAAIRVGVSGVADRPWIVRWPRLTGDELDAALDRLAWDVGARDDQHASGEYRRHLVRTLGRRLIEELQ
ncbi:MAG TPA: FAD binding domain-containing protein [Burkholderiales bacterium]|nr:FAD binding domain-containing protein [Burkholderiales bacterium]